jgi:hypothetical protein
VVLIHLTWCLVDYLKDYFLEEVDGRDLVPYLLILGVRCRIVGEYCKAIYMCVCNLLCKRVEMLV